MDNRPSVKRLLSVREVAAVTGWKESTVRQKVWLREIEYVKLGRSVRFRPEVIERLIERSTVPPISGR